MQEFVLTLALGVAVGVVGNFCYQWTRDLASRLTGRLNMQGIWGEWIVDGQDRAVSVGEIRYDYRQRMWVFDGTNFHNDGTPFCHWKTIASYVDLRQRRFYYVFVNTHVDSTQTSYTGFGVVDFEWSEGTLVPRNGAFAAGNPGEAFRSHAMHRLKATPRNQSEVVALGDQLRSEHNAP